MIKSASEQMINELIKDENCRYERQTMKSNAKQTQRQSHSYHANKHTNKQTRKKERHQKEPN